MSDSHLLLAIWRRRLGGDIEFFVPLAGYPTMRYQIDGDGLADVARRVTSFRFEVDPRGNARIFRQPGDCIVAFNLTDTEAAKIKESGVWLPATLITETSIAFALQELTARL